MNKVESELHYNGADFDGDENLVMELPYWKSYHDVVEPEKEKDYRAIFPWGTKMIWMFKNDELNVLFLKKLSIFNSHMMTSKFDWFI